MFTGIIHFIGEIISIRSSKDGKVIRIQGLDKIVGEPLSLGESISVNGVCLTVCGVTQNYFDLYAGSRTLSSTTLSRLITGSKVNLERALRIGDRIGGHLVQGHIDGVGKIIARKPVGGSTILSISIPYEYLKYLVPNGSIAINGVSLTITNIKVKHFEVSLIPYTAENTNLGKLRIGDEVNFEIDILSKYLKP